MFTEEQQHFGYVIQVTHHAPFWQAAIYPGDRTLPAINWEALNIRAASKSLAFDEARRVVDRMRSPQSNLARI
jgi:hypothetical protein